MGYSQQIQTWCDADQRCGRHPTFTVYKDSRLQLARLKREIARESKALNQPTTETDPVSLSRRIETLESKVDQILQILSKDPR